MSFLYFAYGSNMLPARLIARCESAEVIGTAVAKNHRLEFSKPSKDESGKATLIQAGSEPVQTPGIVFEIAKTDLTNLDRAEGAGHGYEREENFQVSTVATAETLTVTTYLASKTNNELKPFDWYLALVLAGARLHELDAEHQRRLSEVSYDIDTNHTRVSRIEALEALSEHSFHDHHDLLRKT